MFGAGIGDSAWRQMQGDLCPVPVAVIAVGTPLGWPACPARRRWGQASQPSVLQMQHPHPALGHHRLSRAVQPGGAGDEFYASELSAHELPPGEEEEAGDGM